MTKSEEEQKKEQDATLEEMKNAFQDARAYMKAKKAESEKGIPYHDTDLRWESMIPVLKEKSPWWSGRTRSGRSKRLWHGPSRRISGSSSAGVTMRGGWRI